VQVETGVLAAECADLNLIFNHWVVTGRPLLAAKVATTIDGRIACRTGDSKWITGEAARADVMRWRRLFPAIAVGAGTVATDDPRLTARLPEGEWCPLRFVFDAALSTTTLNRCRVCSPTRIGPDRGRHLGGAALGGRAQARGTRRARVAAAGGARVGSQRCVCRPLRARGITGVLVEGGAALIGGLLRQRALDYLLAYRAPRLFADARSVALAEGLRVETPAEGLQLATCGTPCSATTNWCGPHRLSGHVDGRHISGWRSGRKRTSSFHDE